MQSFTATDLANKTGDVLAAAAEAAVNIMRFGKTRYVILTKIQYDKLQERADTRRAIHVDDMTDIEATTLIAELEASVEND